MSVLVLNDRIIKMKPLSVWQVY